MCKIEETVTLNDQLLLAKRISKDGGVTVSHVIPSALNQHMDVEILHALNEEASSSSSIVVAVRGECTIKLRGEWAINLISLNKLAILISFLDLWIKDRGYSEALCEKSVDSGAKELFFSEDVFYASLSESDAGSILDMIIKIKLRKIDSAYRHLLSFICNHESYWLSQFLLSQSVSGSEDRAQKKIYEACKTYGVSASHFRNLCHELFACSPKRQLRLWRGAACILQLVDKKENISAIAYNNGFSSSAHFSYEVKNLFGVTPREFQKLENLFHD